MGLTDYYNLVSGEKRARKYLTQKCLKNGRRFCPKCGGIKLYKLAEDRRRCARCKYTFHDFSGRWINLSRLSCIQWLSVVKLFELDVPTLRIAEQLQINHKTVSRTVDIIRQAIAVTEIINGAEVFGVLENNGKALVTGLPDITAAKMMKLPVKKYRKGSFIYTSRYDGFAGLLTHGSRLKNGCNGNGTLLEHGSFSELQGFMNWAGDRFRKKRAISKRQFPYFLKELEFRYNQKEADVFELVAERICMLVQEVTSTI